MILNSMSRSPRRFFILFFGFVPFFALFLALALPAPPAAAQDRPRSPPPAAAQDRPRNPPPRRGQGRLVDRNAMWPAPTPEDWKRPCLVEFQRTWEDALAVSKETGRPILVCVNMDGEPASEHYAGIRYRRPETAALYEPYVCVIASVYRHNPRDYDDQGRRILCPRFGSVTCGEHIAIERILYEKFFDGRRVAPRHIGVELDGREMYDVYYALDTDSVFEAIREGIEDRKVRPRSPPVHDRSVVDLVTSRDNGDRTALEAAYREAGTDTRRALLKAALDRPGAAQVDLIRLALYGLEAAPMKSLARRALARCDSPEAAALIDEALRAPMEKGERDALIAALERIGEKTPRARMLATVHKGLAGRSAVVNVEDWSRALANAGRLVSHGSPLSPVAAGGAVFEGDLRNQDRILASADPAERLELARAFLASAGEQPGTDERAARYLFRDAHRTALEAEGLGATKWLAEAVLCLSAYGLGNRDEAFRRAETAVKSMPPGETSREALSVLEIFAEGRRREIAAAVQGKKDWDSWSRAFEGARPLLTDLDAAYSVIMRHPLGTEGHVARHYDFLKLVCAVGRASRVLAEGLARFPDAPELHARMRGLLLEQKGPAGLEAFYEAKLREGEPSGNLEWFAGYASIAAAEAYCRGGRDAKALAAYGRAIAHFDRWIASHPGGRDSADLYAALALAGRARLALEKGDLEAALDGITASFARRPDSAGMRDGLGVTPVATARRLLARLEEEKKTDLAGKLKGALAGLDPGILRRAESAIRPSVGPRRLFGRRGGRGSPPNPPSQGKDG